MIVDAGVLPATHLRLSAMQSGGFCMATSVQGAPAILKPTRYSRSKFRSTPRICSLVQNHKNL